MKNLKIHPPSNFYAEADVKPSLTRASLGPVTFNVILFNAWGHNVRYQGEFFYFTGQPLKNGHTSEWKPAQYVRDDIIHPNFLRWDEWREFGDVTYTGETNYDDALLTAWNAYELDPGGYEKKGANTNNILYFISDGDPSQDVLHTGARNTYNGTNNDLGGGIGIDASEENDWESFLNYWDINAHVIGIGDAQGAPNVYNLNPIAYDGRGAGTEKNALVLTNLNLLDDVLLDTIIPALQGTLLNGSTVAGGADGGWIGSITVNNVTFSYDQSTDLSSTSGTSSGTSGVFNTVTNEWTITLPLAIFKIDMDTGDYTYKPNTSSSQVVSYTVRDSDRDTATSTLTLSYTPAPAAPIAIDLGGDGIDYLSVAQSGITQSPLGSFNVAWVAAEDGLLAYDYNGDGSIAEAKEFVFTLWGNRPDVTTDMAALAAYFDGDSMGVKDGLLNSNDLSWSLFGVWQDLNTNGTQDAGEFAYLADWGITSIALAYSADSSAYTAADGDVHVYGQMAVTLVDGSTTVADDMALAVRSAQSQVSGPATTHASPLLATTGELVDAFIQDVVVPNEQVVPPALASLADLVEQYVGEHAVPDQVVAEYQLELAHTELPAAADGAADPVAIEPAADALAALHEGSALLHDHVSDGMATATDGVDACCYFG